MTPEFPNLSSRWATLTPSGVKASNYNPTLTPPPCPAFTSDVWEVDAKSEMPTIGQTYQVQQQSASTTGSSASASPTGQSGQSGSASTEKGAASAVSAWGLQCMGLGVAMVAGLCIWL